MIVLRAARGRAIDASQKPPPQVDSIEDQFKYGSVGIESEEGDALLDLAGAAASLRRQAAAHQAATDRSASCGSPAASFQSASRRQISLAADESPSTAPSATRRRTGWNQQVRGRLSPAGPGNLVNPQAYIALPACRRRGSALQRRRAAVGDRRPDESLVDAADAISMAAHPRHATRASAPETRVRVDGSKCRLGPRPHRSVQSGQVRHSQAADRRHHRECRHDAAVEHEGAAARCTGMA